jgi:8-oxo-dGTP pyrophosphatase MutT (NUDIX family)
VADFRDEAASWPVLQSSVLAEARIVTLRKDVVQLPDGQTVQREVVEHPGAVAIVALDSSDRVLMIRQYRHPAGAMLWEIPAGLRDGAGEPLLATAQRELLEEAGCQAREWHVLSDYLSSPGISTERLRVYLARDLTMVPAGQREYVRHEEEAYLTVAWMPLADAVQQVLSGGLHNGVAIVGILSAYVAQREDFRAVRPADSPESL